MISYPTNYLPTSRQAKGTNIRKNFMKREDLVEPDLCYKIVGAVFEVGSELGPGHKEVYYQKAVALAFTKRKLSFQEQVPINVRFEGTVVGRQFLDFVVDGRVVVELKRGDHFASSNIKQIFGYLKATGLQLGILVNFTSRGVKYRRIVNTY